MYLSRNVRMVLLLTCVLCLSMLSRLIFSPLLVQIKTELGLSGSEAGSIFLLITLGYSPGMLFSGFISARLKHSGTIVFSLLLVAVGLIIISLSGNFTIMIAGLITLGVGTGLYPSSGIASITETVSAEKTGKALAVHEMGPGTAFVAAPLIVLAFSKYLNWRHILWGLAFVNILVAVIYTKHGLGGESYGKPPHFERLKTIIKNPAAWFCFLLFCVALSSMQGIYSILPYYLVTVKNLDSDWVNSLVGLSRVSGLIALMVSGTLVDKYGSRPVLMVAFLVSGISTFFLGITSGLTLAVFVVLQPALISAFFPAGLLALSRIGPPESKNVTFSFVINFAVLFGNGIVPTFFGWLGDLGVIGLGFLILGSSMLLAVLLLYKNRSFGLAGPEIS